MQLMVFYTAFPLCTVLANVFSLKWCKMDVQNFVMVHHGISGGTFLFYLNVKHLIPRSRQSLKNV